MDKLKHRRKDKKTLKHFFRYIKDEGVYKEYIKNFLIERDKEMLSIYKEDATHLLLCSFNWRETKEGDHFWRELYEKYAGKEQYRHN